MREIIPLQTIKPFDDESAIDLAIQTNNRDLISDTAILNGIGMQNGESRIDKVNGIIVTKIDGKIYKTGILEEI